MIFVIKKFTAGINPSRVLRPAGIKDKESFYQKESATSREV